MTLDSPISNTNIKLCFNTKTKEGLYKTVAFNYSDLLEKLKKDHNVQQQDILYIERTPNIKTFL